MILAVLSSTYAVVRVRREQDCNPDPLQCQCCALRVELPDQLGAAFDVGPTSSLDLSWIQIIASSQLVLKWSSTAPALQSLGLDSCSRLNSARRCLTTN